MHAMASRRPKKPEASIFDGLGTRLNISLVPPAGNMHFLESQGLPCFTCVGLSRLCIFNKIPESESERTNSLCCSWWKADAQEMVICISSREQQGHYSASLLHSSGWDWQWMDWFFLFRLSSITVFWQRVDACFYSSRLDKVYVTRPPLSVCHPSAVLSFSVVLLLNDPSESRAFIRHLSS